MKSNRRHDMGDNLDNMSRRSASRSAIRAGSCIRLEKRIDE